MPELSEVLLTVTPAQRDELALNLKPLREHGAESNTAAVLEAVREKADSLRLEATEEGTVRLIIDLNDPDEKGKEALDLAMDALLRAGFNPYRGKAEGSDQVEVRQDCG